MKPFIGRLTITPARQIRLLLVVLEILQLASLWRFWMLLDQRDTTYVGGQVPPAYLGVGVGLGILSVLVLGVFTATWWVRPDGWRQLELRSLNLLGKLRAGNLVLFGLGIGCFSWLVLGVDSWVDGGNPVRWCLFTWLVLVGAFFIKACRTQPGLEWMRAIIASLLISSAGYMAAMFLNDVSLYPFSLNWSETSRYWYASLYLSDRLYGFHIPPSVLHPTRYLLQAVPFVIENSPLWLHRLWQALLWIGTTLGAAILLARRLAIAERYKFVMLVCFAFLFLLAGPVYYHLLVPVILVLWGFNLRRPWKSLLVVLLASVWSGLSRLNWVPVPGLLAATLYLLEKPINLDITWVETSRRLVLTGRRWLLLSWRYLRWPMVWVVAGTILAYLAQLAYERYSGNPIEQFRSSFSSQLLWYRLFPNATYRLGILINSVWFFLPLFVLVVMILWAEWRKYQRLPAGNVLRWVVIFGILAILFGGGILVSVKIGGGSNLHNLDAFMTLFLVASSYWYFEKTAREAPETNGQASGGTIGQTAVETDQQPVSRHREYRPPALVMAAVLLVPVVFTISSGANNALPDQETVTTSLSAIQDAVDLAYEFAPAENLDASATSPVQALFITERHLLTFKTIRGVQIIPDYEKVFLMEMAMANNESYLDTFYQQLKRQQFALIVSEPLKINYQDRYHAFNEENNAWVKRVAVPILCYYEPYQTLKQVRVQLLVPRQKEGTEYLGEGRPSNCP